MSVQGLHQTEHKSFGHPDEPREFPGGRAEEEPVGVVDWYGASNYAKGSS